MQFVSVMVEPNELPMPPPLAAASLPLMVQFVRVAVTSRVFWMPPPWPPLSPTLPTGPPVELPLTVLSVMTSDPADAVKL